MKIFELSVDFNGIVLFEPERLVEYFDGEIPVGENLYRKFTTTNAGDEVVQEGIVVPVLAINDGFYKVIVRFAVEPSPIETNLFVVENAAFPLQIGRKGFIVLADLAVLWEWEADLGWNGIDVQPGNYTVSVRGFRKIENNEISECGYEFVLSPTSNLPPLTAILDKDMQVLCLPE